MAFALQKEGNDRMNFICDEDIGHTSKPSSWTQVLALLKEDYANSMVLRAFAEVIGRSIFVVTANGASKIIHTEQWCIKDFLLRG